MWKWSVFAGALLVAILVARDAGATPSSGGDVTPWWFSLLYLACGALGALVAADRDPERGFVLPHRLPEARWSWDAGFPGDAVLGMAGAIAILLIVPGKPEVGFAIEGMPTLALAVIGGYGARAVLEAALSSRLARVETETSEILRRRKRAEEAKRTVQSHLEGTQELKTGNFVALFTDLPADAPLDLFRIADQKRSDWRKAGRRAEIARVLPILEALERTADDVVPKADLQAAIAMAHVDKDPPDFQVALHRIGRAIEHAKQTPAKGEVVRAVSLVKLWQEQGHHAELAKKAKEAVLALRAKGGWIKNPSYRDAVNAFMRHKDIEPRIEGFAERPGGLAAALTPSYLG